MADSAPDISIVVPSRLQTQPDSGGALWIDRALASVAAQTVLKKTRIEILVGLDAGVESANVGPPHLKSCMHFINAPAGSKPGQASAVNAAANLARGEFLAILEDDDAWQPMFLELARKALKESDFVSSSQMLVDQKGFPREVMYFPTPSGWLMRRTVWQEIGGFDERLHFHVDVEWIGRLNKSGRNRTHLVESGFPLDRPFLEKHRRWLAHLAKGQPNPVRLIQHRMPVPLVIRTLNETGGTGRIRRNKDAAERSKKEMAAIRRRFGELPW
jgi:GT2 family glycosyltransferase